ncbi:MAG TPA: SURF1 family protein [Lysobacter sp.]
MSRRATLLLGWTLALLAAAGLGSLGAWQGGRAVEKERMLAAADAVLARRQAVPLAAGDATDAGARYDWAAGRGSFLATPPILLDNQQRDGRVGMRAYAAFQPQGGAPLLVDLGWQAVGGDRAPPQVRVPEGEVDLRGLLAPPPSPGIRMGAAMVLQGDALLAVRLETAAVAAALGLPRLAPRVLRLDPELPIGYTRDLQLFANTLTPDRHRGYAVQWYGLALTTLAIALVLTFRRSRR